MSSLTICALVALASIVGCSRGGDKEAAGEAGSGEARAPGGEAAAPTGDNAPGVRLRVTLTGGQDAGTYDLQPPTSACIDYQATGVNGMAAAFFADPDARQHLRMIDFGTSQKVPTAGSVTDFGFRLGMSTPGAALEDAAAHRTYEVRPSRGLGSGTATVSGTGPRYTARISGKTPEGVGVEATLECLK